METTTAAVEPKKPVSKTFKDVHAELERESLFLTQGKFDPKTFAEKGEFLDKLGFGNTIAAKLYLSVANNHHVVQEYAVRYGGKYKFILEPQLERVCEKYNLFVREPKYFLADIPATNIQHMMDFKVFISDLPIMRYEPFCDLIGEKYKEALCDFWRGRTQPNNEWAGTFDVERGQFFRGNAGGIEAFIIDGPSFGNNINSNAFPREIIDTFVEESEWFKKETITLTEVRRYFPELLKIAAVKDMFSESAFLRTSERIPSNFSYPEMAAKFTVDLDPIVLCQTKNGYLIVTAWGDEANDELVANQTLN